MAFELAIAIVPFAIAPVVLYDSVWYGLRIRLPEHGIWRAHAVAAHALMEIVNESIAAYLDEWSRHEDRILVAMEEHAETCSFPIIGPQVGRLLFLLVAGFKPKRIFEMGSGFGYSAYWMLKASPVASMVCTEKNTDNIARARTWLAEGGVLERSEWRQGDALDSLRSTNETFDLIFNDVNKEDYPEAFALALGHLRRGGMLLCDNVLWRGQVAEPALRDKATEAVREYNRLMFRTPGVFSSIVPVRDGLGITMKME